MEDETEAGQDRALGHGPCVLVVEDEFLIRMMVSDILRDGGMTVIEAANGEEAVAILKAGAPVDLVFTDVRMPGSIDGLEVLAFVRQTRPELPVIVTSGHLAPALAYDGGAKRFVGKPCDPQLLSGIIRSELKASL